MASKYTIEYLNENERRGGDGNGVTPGSFLGGKLKGSSRRWLAGYRRALERELISRMHVDIYQGQSVNGATAYYWRDGKEK